jgi:purine-binding chemotaxis protein CheW
MTILKKGRAMHDTTTSRGSQAVQFLSFTLGGLEYGIDFARVQELRVLKALERFAASGEIIGGVAVSRGVIIPLVDMRVACGTAPDAPDPMTDVIILRLSSCVMGMVVDGVTGVVTLVPEQVAPLPAPAADGARPDYLLGLGQAGGRRLVLVDIEKLMSVTRPAARQVA